MPREERPRTVQIKDKRAKRAATETGSGIMFVGNLKRIISSPAATG